MEIKNLHNALSITPFNGKGKNARQVRKLLSSGYSVDGNVITIHARPNGFHQIKAWCESLATLINERGLSAFLIRIKDGYSKIITFNCYKGELTSFTTEHVDDMKEEESSEHLLMPKMIGKFREYLDYIERHYNNVQKAWKMINDAFKKEGGNTPKWYC